MVLPGGLSNRGRNEAPPGRRGPRSLALAALLTCGTSVWSSRAAPPPRVALSWEPTASAAGCVSREAAVQMIHTRLRRPPFTASNAEFLITARLDQPTEGRWEATFVVTRADGSTVGRRTLSVEAPSCRVLDGPMALVLTLLAEAPERAAESAVPSPSAPSSAPSSEPLPALPPAPSASSPTPATVPAPTPPERAPLSGSLLLGAVLSPGAVPGAGPGVKLGTSLGSSWWRGRLEASYLFAGTTPADGPGVRVSSVQLGAAGCARRAAVATLRVEGCVGLRAGLTRGAGQNLTVEQSTTVLTHGVTLSAAALLPIGPVWLRAGLGAQLATARARFLYDAPAGVAIPWTSSRVQPEIDLALELPWGP